MAKKDIPQKKQTYGTATVNHISPKNVAESPPKALRIVFSFEEALKLHLSLGQALGQLNSYDRSRKEAREVGVCFHLHEHGRMMVTEAKIQRQSNGKQTNANPEAKR